MAIVVTNRWLQLSPAIYSDMLRLRIRERHEHNVLNTAVGIFPYVFLVEYLPIVDTIHFVRYADTKI